MNGLLTVSNNAVLNITQSGYLFGNGTVNANGLVNVEGSMDVLVEFNGPVNIIGKNILIICIDIRR
jgi:hypothetical protein